MYKAQEECLGEKPGSCSTRLGVNQTCLTHQHGTHHYESCIGNILATLGTLSREEEAELAAIEEDYLHLRKGNVIQKEGETSLYLYSLNKGWAYACRTISDGSRQVLDIFVPGDIIGLCEYSLKKNNTEVVMLTDGKVYPTYKESLIDATRQYQGLSERIFSLLIYQHNIVMDRLKSFIQHDAMTRIVHFILELHSRFSRINKVKSLSLSVPLPQTLIGKLLGMSGVHVSRCFSQLEEQGLIRRGHGVIKILKYRKMVELSHFESDFLARQIEEGERMFVT